MRRSAVAIMLCAARAHAAPVALPDGQLEADVTVEANLAPGLVAQPLSIAPDLWWGATHHLTLGLIHSHASVDQIDTGATLCLRTVVLECDRLYRGSGVDARYLVYDAGGFQIAPRVRFLIRDVHPVKPAVTLGAFARWRAGRWAIAGDPFLQLGLANQGAGNRAQLWLPVFVELNVACAWQLFAQTGWNTELANAGDAWHLPLGLGARATLSRHVEIGAEAGFPSLLGPLNNVKQRVAMLTVSIRGP